MSRDRRRGVGTRRRPASVCSRLMHPFEARFLTVLSQLGRAPRLGSSAGVRLATMVLVIAAITVGVAGGAVADSTTSASVQEEGEPPELSGGDRINDTAVRLVFTDDTGVDVDSIDEADFLLSVGEKAGLSVSESGPNAVVDLRLEAPIDADELTVGVRNGSAIQDVDGNTIDTSEFVGTTIGGMDGVPPSVRRLEVPDRASESADIRLVFDEAVSTFHVRLSGPREGVLTRDDFQRVRGGLYVLTYDPPADGVYTIEVVNATDPAGNHATFSASTSMEVRTADVRAVAGVDLSESGGLNLTFDASRSDDRAVAFLWDFDDGETATGRRVSHAFSPGNYTVELEVIDEFGNVGRDEVSLNLTANATGFGPGSDGDGRPRVTIERENADSTSTVQIGVTGATANDQLLVRTSETDEPLVASETLALDEMVVTPARDGGFGLGIEAASAESELVAAATQAAEGEAVGGFVVRPTITDEALSNVTVRYRVDSDRLGDAGVTPDEVSLYREEGGSWQEMETSTRGVSEEWVTYESELPGFSRFAVVAANDDEQSETENNAGEGSNGTDGGETGPENATGENSTGPGNATNDQFEVRNVTLSETSLEPGETVEIQAEIVNQGDEPGDFLAALERNGSVLSTQEVLRIPPDGESLPVMFTRQVNGTGTVQFSVNGTAAPELSVGGGGGGGLFGFLGFLGVLPLGLLRTLLMFVVAPLAVVFLGLKGVATYMGY